VSLPLGRILGCSGRVGREFPEGSTF